MFLKHETHHPTCQPILTAAILHCGIHSDAHVHWGVVVKASTGSLNEPGLTIGYKDEELRYPEGAGSGNASPSC